VEWFPLEFPKPSMQAPMRALQRFSVERFWVWAQSAQNTTLKIIERTQKISLRDSRLFGTPFFLDIGFKD
jgi:hypothetical protein